MGTSQVFLLEVGRTGRLGELASFKEPSSRTSCRRRKNFEGKVDSQKKKLTHRLGEKVELLLQPAVLLPDLTLAGKRF